MSAQKFETSDVDGILNGDLDAFIKQYLLAKREQGSP